MKICKNSQAKANCSQNQKQRINNFSRNNKNFEE